MNPTTLPSVLTTEILKFGTIPDMANFGAVNVSARKSALDMPKYLRESIIKEIQELAILLKDRLLTIKYENIFSIKCLYDPSFEEKHKALHLIFITKPEIDALVIATLQKRSKTLDCYGITSDKFSFLRQAISVVERSKNMPLHEEMKDTSLSFAMPHVDESVVEQRMMNTRVKKKRKCSIQ